PWSHTHCGSPRRSVSTSTTSTCPPDGCTTGSACARSESSRRCCSNRAMHHVLAVLPQFALACLVLAVLPGPATALFVHRAVRDGRAAGLAAVAGNEIGVFGWALAAGAGLTALLQANRVLFQALHLVGGLVLVYLGVAAWRAARRPEAGLAPPAWLSSGRS